MKGHLQRTRKSLQPDYEDVSDYFHVDCELQHYEAKAKSGWMRAESSFYLKQCKRINQ